MGNIRPSDKIKRSDGKNNRWRNGALIIANPKESNIKI
jgi:hypothetical protein